jgi:integral membrane protein (TIGR01906 family)
MRDVKRVVRGAFAAQEASLVYVLAYLGAVVLWARERRIRALCWQVLGGIGLGGAFAAAIGALALSGFDRTWDCFHEIAFRNDLWRLDPDTDRLIQMFPEPFWQEATFLTAGVTAAEALVLAALCGLYLAFGRRGGRQAGP